MKPRSVLDVGCGLGFWGVVLRGYLGVDRIVCIDVDPVKVSFAGGLSVYSELHVSDIRSFKCAGCFDIVLAVESIHGIIDADLIRRLESMVRDGGLIVMALPGSRLGGRVLTSLGYNVYRYLLRGFILVRVDGGEVLAYPSRVWMLAGSLLRLFAPLLRFFGVLDRGYLLAYKVVRHG
ncbi:class I SAM-dependent methyltransferase [Infirmifilum sp.]|uniref:class I SAM-dependent methyltransferase n=1 Tax=Infirmifilum sp. TaxID=2856575 RepID=UPI003D13881F